MKIAYFVMDREELVKKRGALPLSIVPIALAVGYIFTELSYTMQMVLFGDLSPYCSFTFLIATVVEACAIIFLYRDRPTEVAVSKWLSICEILLLALTIGYIARWVMIQNSDMDILELSLNTIPWFPLFCFGAVAVLQIAYAATNRRSMLGIGTHCLWIAILDLLLQVSVFRGVDYYDVRFLLSIPTFWIPALVGPILFVGLPLVVKLLNKPTERGLP